MSNSRREHFWFRMTLIPAAVYLVTRTLVGAGEQRKRAVI